MLAVSAPLAALSAMAAVHALTSARQIADEVLFPSAMNVDAADRVPPGHFDALAAAGLFGLAGPAQAGGLDTDLATFCNVIEIMAGGCLATTFVWLQHHGAVRALAASANSALAGEWLAPLCAGARRAGVALGGARPGSPLLSARAAPGGYLFNGAVPWVTGWDMIHVVYTLARDEAGNVVGALLPATASASLAAGRLELAAVNASRTVGLRFAAHFVPAELVSGVMPLSEWQARDAAGLRANGSLALGLTVRCIQLMDQLRPATAAAPLQLELAAARARLDAADTSSMPAARAAAAELAFRAAGALAVAAGSRSVMVDQHPQRLAREALFLLVFGSRPAIRERLTSTLISPRG
jgi:alkylation response protein AidB-like acyl-CoA dehydrogenase